MVNPFLIVMREAQQGGDTPELALLKMMMAAQGNLAPTAIILAIEWECNYGPPTWESLDKWAREFVANPEAAVIVENMMKAHEKAMEGADDELRKLVEETC